MRNKLPPPKIVSSCKLSCTEDHGKTVLKKPASVKHAGRPPRVEARPCFASSWIEENHCDSRETITEYAIAGVRVRISSPRDSSCGLYAIDPPEYRLNSGHLRAMADAISEIVRIMPTDMEVSSISVVRPYIKTKAKDYLYSRIALLSENRDEKGELDKEAERLAELLCKYTAGYGVLETLLEDALVQDIYVDAPSSQTPVRVVLRSDTLNGVRQKCQTNIFVGRRDLQSFVSRIKFETGLPFSEAHPVLEADIRRLGSRVTLVGPPLSDKGVSVAIRKHSESIWSMPMLVGNKTLSPLLSSFLWSCVIGRRTALIAGSRGAGKTTLLGAMLLEFPLSQRVILIEDTPEIPIRRLQDLGYDIQSLRFSGGGSEMTGSAEAALKVSLRMGESAIVIGEVRGAEAKVLYESMRAGNAGSSVLGTIHGNSATGVLDRAVEDLGVSERAFSSTDIVVVIGLIRSPDGSRFTRRVVEVAEVRSQGPRVELVPLFATEPGCLCAKPTANFSAECKTVKGVASALGTTPDRIMEIVKTRAHADQISSETCQLAPCSRPGSDDSMRIRSNEVLTRCLFDSECPESGLRKWKEWFDAEKAGR